MKIAAASLFRNEVLDFNPKSVMNKDNPGGGLSIKAYNLEKAVANIHILSDINEASKYPIIIVEPHWFVDIPSDADFSERFKEKVNHYKSLSALKILWTSDLLFGNFTGDERQSILEGTDVFAGNSPHMVQMLKSYIHDSYHDKIMLLTDPIDGSDITPLDNPDEIKKYIYACGQASIEKGIEDIIEIFDRTTFKTVYIGNPNTWGCSPRYTARLTELYETLKSTADYVIPAANRDTVKQIARNAWGYVNASRYESFSYACAEAMSSSTFCFCGIHPVFNDRPVFRFETPLQAVELIEQTFEKYGKTLYEPAREYVLEHYSYDMFRKQLHNIIGEGINYGFGMHYPDVLRQGA